MTFPFDLMPHAYTEEQLVEQPAIGLFAELGLAIFQCRYDGRTVKFIGR